VTASRASDPKRLPVNGRTVAQLAAGSARASAASVLRRVPFPYRAPTVPTGIEPPTPKPTLGKDYDTDWARSYPARMSRVLLVEGVVRPAMGLLAAPTIAGLDRLADLEAPAIFAANHHSHLDTPLLLANIPEPFRHRMVIGAAADYFFGNQVTAPLSALVIGAVPIERTRISRRSADDTAALIADGWNFLIFPEGGRSPDGWGQPFRGGAAYLSLRCDVPVVPIHIEGTGRILRKGRSIPKPSTTTITFGRPMRPTEDEDSRSFGGRIERAVNHLADEAATDWWTARKRAHQSTTPSLQGPTDVGAWRRAWSLGDRSRSRRRSSRSWPTRT
jgi:1-acyl-sn-glycerol-3-phosphate acyltransferase